MRSDRLSAIRQWGLEGDAALREESRLGLDVIRSGETRSGAQRARDGTGPSTEILRYTSARSISSSETTVDARPHTNWPLIFASLLIALPTALLAQEDAPPGGAVVGVAG